MYKTKERNKRTDNDYLAVNGDTLAGILDCGRATAVKIGTDAGAKIQIGNRVLYKLSIIDKYLDSIAGN